MNRHHQHLQLPRGLYAITDGPRPDLVSACRAAIAGGAAVLQYRDKSRDSARRRDEASSLVALCRQHRLPLIVNDDIALARTVGADGVHLGGDDEDPRAARAALGTNALIGVSCYASLARAREAAAAGADYLAFGAFFPSSSKDTPHRATTTLIADAADLGLPMVAIGGINADNGAPLVAAGAHCLAAISAVFEAPDIESAARRITRLFETDA